MAELQGHSIDLRAQPGRLELGVETIGNPDIGVPEQTARSERWRSRHLKQAGAGPPEVVEAEFPHLGNGPEEHLVPRTEALCRARGPLTVGTSPRATPLLIALTDVSAAECAAEHLLQPHILAHSTSDPGARSFAAPPALMGEKELRAGGFRGLFEPGDRSVWDGKLRVRAALGRLAVPAPPKQEHPPLSVDVLLPQGQRFALPQAQEDADGEQRTPARVERGQKGLDLVYPKKVRNGLCPLLPAITGLRLEDRGFASEPPLFDGPGEGGEEAGPDVSDGLKGQRRSPV